MDANRIDFISSYCDRWCERCAFTDRCSSFACDVAIAMCGDVEEGITLAVGRPRSPTGAEGDRDLETPDFVNQMPSEAETTAFRRAEDARRQRIEASPLSRMAWKFMRLSTAWIRAHQDCDEHSDPLLREAFQVVAWDSTFITVKLHRAMDGRDRVERNEEGEDDPIQNDWNGSAKVALISIDRSVNAWAALGDALSDAPAASLSAALGLLRRAVLDQFPDAMRFKRPGFDDLSATRVGTSDGSE